MNNKVVLGLSGGVDSTTAALLLKEKGFEVIGYYFDPLGCNINGVESAKKIANELNIQFISKDVSNVFKEIVIENFCKEYSSGHTPNPCVVCNPNIKFKSLLDTANELGAKYIATGHYASIIKDTDSGNYFLKKGLNQKKDQTYMMYRLGQDVLSRLLLPLGEVEDKSITREIARENNFSNSEQADSQEICFIDEEKQSYKDFIEEQGYQPQKGYFVDCDGNVLGEHSGLINYTIGQRKGLGITFGKPVFVTNIDAQTKKITLGDNIDLFSKEVFSVDNFFTERGTNFFSNSINEEKKIMAKIRYAAKPAPAKIIQKEDGILTVFEDSQRAATPGQSIVFYDEDRVIGGGFIK